MPKNATLNNWFIIRLYHHSRFAFVIVALYLILYAFFFIKKMDMVVFPYNSMFAIDFSDNNTSETYQLKIDGKAVRFTNKWWWKKDFMETSLKRYALLLHDTPYIEKYIAYAYANKSYRELFLNQLKPSTTDKSKWLFWYAKFGNVNLKKGQVFSIWQYRLHFEKEIISIDSSLIFTQSFK